MALNTQIYTKNMTLSPMDPQPVDIVNPSSTIPILLVCEHAGFAIPKCLDNLGISQTHIYEHMGGDIGAKAVAVQLAEYLGVTLVYQNYSRLVIDCNRPPYSDQSIVHHSDGVCIIGNQNISDTEKKWRTETIFTPYDNALQDIFTTRTIALCFSIHSFTKTLHNSPNRPWDLGMVSRLDISTASRLVEYCLQQRPDLNMVVNQPYQIEYHTDWFIVQYAEKHKVKHSLIEICNSHLRNPQGIDTYVHMLQKSIQKIAKEYNIGGV